MKWSTLNLRISNVHLLHGRRPVLIDSGPPGRFGALRAKLRALGIETNELGAVVLTHGQQPSSFARACRSYSAREIFRLRQAGKIQTYIQRG
jgi:hypothetical protein